MSLGELICKKRKELKLTQEELAGKLSVSRSAVAKWESLKGVPDVDNIKALSKELNISIDKLLNNNETKEVKSKRDEYIESFISKRCTIELTDWNDGIFDGYILNQDSDFLFYLILEKKKVQIGLLGKNFIKEIRLSDKKEKYYIDLKEYSHIDRDFFVDKKANVNLNEKHIWSGIVGKETQFSNVLIYSLTRNRLAFELNNEVSIDEIVKIELM